ncbi:cell division protein FtsK [Brachybacterium sp. JHP9]|uniref:Cell division protein FtsK n=1 Tax=Brachybacterium equifaecis TaxID=2910770 RepID=A0ABT0R3G9_9MICO|nr:FtsK/SpoIIIE domain-containing protein [Brachybacterium equifaecis]MCL6424284.1 cell division protein FtsK [Brachybacterium equifaecis]
MRLRLSLLSADGGQRDLEITADATATVGDLAEALHAGSVQTGSPAARPGRSLAVSVRVRSGDECWGEVLSPGALLLRSGIRSGAVIEVVTWSADRRAPADPQVGEGQRAALLRIVAGPERGREIHLPEGTVVLLCAGAEQASADALSVSVAVAIAEPALERHPLRLTIGAQIDLVDLSAAGEQPALRVSGAARSRAVLGPGQIARIGATEFSVAPLRATGAPDPVTPALEFNRSPRVLAAFPEQSVRAPQPPKPPVPQPFPLLMVLAPLLMGALMYALTRSPYSLLFVAMMPLMALAAHASRRLQDARQLERASRLFEEQLALLEGQVAALQHRERAIRLAELPGAAECADAIDRLGPLLWTHRPEHEAFLALRLGIGAAPSRVEIEEPPLQDALPLHARRIRETLASHVLLGGVPIRGDLRSCGNIGIAGHGAATAGAARALVLQLAALHSPADVTIAAVASAASRREWEWLTWLPHCADPRSPLRTECLASTAERADHLVGALEELMRQRIASAGASGAPTAAPRVVLIVEDDAPVRRSRLVQLLEHGPAAGIHVLWRASALSALPAACRTFLQVSEHSEGSSLPEEDAAASAAGTGATALSGSVLEGARTSPVHLESLTRTRAAVLARRLAPLVDAGEGREEESDVPGEVSFLQLAGGTRAFSEQSLLAAWRDPGAAGLAALVGRDGRGPMRLDLRAQGPHALVGGTTGAGKSEFLQTWVLAMAAAHSPARVTFLFVDYKGGAAFADCTALPHAVGMVTDLGPAMVRRALTSLRAELRRREHLLHRKGAKDLAALERMGDPDAPPSLVIVVDEFAALAAEVPEFVDGVVDIAARGRSLGLHLILATQRPAGVIRDSLRANASLRIALRLADAADSTDVLGDSRAAGFDPALPGRAAMRAGPGSVVTFQAAFAGGRTAEQGAAGPLEIVELDFGRGERWESAERERPAPVLGDGAPTDIARIVNAISAAARAGGIAPAHRPWLPQLAPVYDLLELPSPRRDDTLVIGVKDVPEEQSQPVLEYRPDRDGGMVVLGASGSGKSTTLRTIAIAAATATARGGPVHVYALDFSGAALAPLEPLPHVGAVITAEDEERVSRLLRTLCARIEERSVRFAACRTSTISEFRSRADEPALPRIVLLLDGIGAFREAGESARLAHWMPSLLKIAVEGRQVGVHLVVSADRSGALPAALASCMQHRLVHRAASDEDSPVAGRGSAGLHPDSPPGRGFLQGSEVQIGAAGGSASLAAQAEAISALAAEMREAGVRPAPGVPRLPSRISWREIERCPRAENGSPPGLPIGVAEDTLEPVEIDPRGLCLVSGPRGSGRTTAVRTIAEAALHRRPDMRRVRLAARASPLAKLPLWDAEAVDAEQCAALAAALSTAIAAGEVREGRLAVFIDGLMDLAGTPAQTAVEALIRDCAREGHLVLGEAESSAWFQSHALAQPFRSARRGLLLHPAEGEPEQLLGATTSRSAQRVLPPGRGLLIARGTSVALQVALPAGTSPLPAGGEDSRATR